MFTRQQILEIQQKLASNGFKDSDFEVISGLDGTEYLAVIKNGTNKRVLVGTLNDYIIENANVPTKLSQLEDDSTHRLVTDTQKTTWSSKYTKPSSGIPARDLAAGVIPDVSNFITRTVANLTNYYTKSETYTRQQIQSLISQIHSFTIEVVNSLPTASSSTMYKIYLVPSQNAETQNVKDEYITLATTSGSSTSYSWEQIGSTAIDLSGYVTTTALANALLGYQATLVSGENIKTINGVSILGSGDVEIEGSSGSGEQVQSDWEQDDNTQVDYIKNKPTIPDVSSFITKSVNDLTYYYLKTETYTQTEVNNLIAAINQFHYEIAASTSAVSSPASNVLYLIGPTGSGADKYEEYVYASNQFVKIGDTSIDLSGYVTTSALNTALANYTTTTDLTTLLQGKQDALVDMTFSTFMTLWNDSIAPSS